MDANFDELSLLQSFLSEVKKFKALERLEFGVTTIYLDELNFEEYFNGLQSLTHLSISLAILQFSRHDIETDLLNGIDKSLPKLRVLYLKDVYLNRYSNSMQNSFFHLI